MTAFVHARVELLPDLAIVIDGNSKITAGNGTYAAPAPNAFSLPAASVSSPGFCPRSTATCRASCYVRGLAKAAPKVYEAYRENAEVLRELLGVPSDILRRLAIAAFGEWIAAHCAGGFRWHVSGDVWNTAHARFITAVCAASPGVRHWIYTRTFDAVPFLVAADNLAVNVSADRDNYAEALACAKRHGVRVAYMATIADAGAPGDMPVPCDLPEGDGSVIFPDYPLRGRELIDPCAHPFWQSLPHRRRLQVCAADQFGQSEAHRCGPCDRCMNRVDKPAQAV